MLSRSILVVCLCVHLFQQLAFCEDDDEDPYTSKDPSKREPSPCEVCKFFATELKTRLVETGKNREIIETGHGLEKKKRFSYHTSELRLTEALQDPHVCDKILHYNVHAEREGSNRYAKGMSETMSTLHGLRNKGVKVELGIPEEMWDQPSAEVTKMQRSCYKLAEDYEELIEDWYYHHQDKDLMNFLCTDKFLPDKKFSAACLEEKQIESSEKGDRGEKKKKKKKAKKNKKGDSSSDNTSNKTKKKRVKRDGDRIEL